jgi:very-short-patch-repair endonuclease
VDVVGAVSARLPRVRLRRGGDASLGVHVDGFTHHGAEPSGEPIRRLPGYLLELCRELRRQEAPPETALWRLLRGRQLPGLEFRRQHVIGRYVADFYCHGAGLVIELDGAPHDGARQGAYDGVSDRELQHLGLCVLRFRNEGLREDAAGVLERIAEAAQRHPSPPAPLP